MGFLIPSLLYAFVGVQCTQLRSLHKHDEECKMGEDLPVVIAHRGACGYLPEHTLPGKALAFQMGANYLEQDVVQSSDGVLFVLHDIFLEGITDVADKFPDRISPDGHYFTTNFTAAEMKSLRVSERFELQKDGSKVQTYPNRFPTDGSTFELVTFEEELQFIQGLNRSTGKNVGIYPEIKAPAIHRNAGLDISKAFLQLLKQYGYVDGTSNCIVQCFDPNELKRIKYELMPELGMDLPLIQLITEDEDNEVPVFHKDGSVTYDSYAWMFEKTGMRKVAAYADGIGPWKNMLISEKDSEGKPIVKDLMRNAHAAGLLVHPYTFRADVPYTEVVDATDPDSFQKELEMFYSVAKVDGLFTDFPDKAVEYVRANKEALQIRPRSCLISE